MGEILIRGTAIMAVGCYSARMLMDLGGKTDDCQRAARWFWTVGCIGMIVHVACAFHFQHGWSHAAAWEHTRQRTLELTGWNSGAGLYFNEAMTVLWLVDVVGWWKILDWPRRQRVWFWIVQCVFAFMMVNATAVFGPGYWRVVAVAFVGALVWGRFAARR